MFSVSGTEWVPCATIELIASSETPSDQAARARACSTRMQPWLKARCWRLKSSLSFVSWR